MWLGHERSITGNWIESGWNMTHTLPPPLSSFMCPSIFSHPKPKGPLQKPRPSTVEIDRVKGEGVGPMRFIREMDPENLSYGRNSTENEERHILRMTKLRNLTKIRLKLLEFVEDFIWFLEFGSDRLRRYIRPWSIRCAVDFDLSPWGIHKCVYVASSFIVCLWTFRSLLPRYKIMTRKSQSLPFALSWFAEQLRFMSLDLLLEFVMTSLLAICSNITIGLTLHITLPQETHFLG